MHNIRVDLIVCVGGHAHQLSSTFSTPVGLASCIFLSECVEWVGSHACTR